MVYYMRILRLKKMPTHRLTVYLFLTWLLTALEIDWVVGMTDYMTYLSPMALAESLLWGAVIMVPFLLLPCKMRWLQLVVFFVLVLFNAINSIYYANFGSFVPLRAFGMWQGINTFTWEAAKATVGYRDLIVWIALGMQVALFWYFRDVICHERFSRRFIVMCCIVVGMSVGLLQAVRYRRYLATPSAFDQEYKTVDSFIALTGTISDFDRKGYFEMYIIQLYHLVIPVPPLSADEKAAIRSIVTSAHAVDGNEDVDMAVGRNKGKNLIFIIVESLNSSALHRTAGGRSMTPFIDSLAVADDVLCFDNMRTQALLGESSDGQFIYNTGLYPLVGEITMSVNHTGPYPSICRELKGYECREYIGEMRDVWYHKDSSKAYGYDMLIDNLENINGATGDEAIMSTSLEALKRLQQPFFAMVTTVGMHMPFDLSPEQVAHDWSYSPQAYGYMLKTALFDRALASFIGGLKQVGLYDNTIVVIASDHQIPYGAVGDVEFDDGRIMLMILNSGLSGRTDSRVVGQIDVYPTVLDVMGVRNPGWCGMGQSLLRTVPGFAVLYGTEVVGNAHDISAIARQKDYWQLSSRMIKTNTFPYVRGVSNGSHK